MKTYPRIPARILAAAGGLVALPCCTLAATATFDGDFYAHGAISTFTGSFGNAAMTAKPDFMPFMSPAPGATRFLVNPVASLGGIPTILNGYGSAELTPLGTTTAALGDVFDNFSLSTFGNGLQLPTAGALGTLDAPLTLGVGDIVPSGTPLYADFRGFVLDHNKPSNFWFDTAEGVMHQVYEGGYMDFYYEDAPGSFRNIGSFDSGVLHSVVDYAGDTATHTWSANPSPGTLFSLLIEVNSFEGAVRADGVLPAELATDPYVGIFASYETSFSITFAAIPETPANAAMLALGVVGIMGVRGLRSRRNRPV